MNTIGYSAPRILTMNPSQLFAGHMAVRDGRILRACSLGSLKGRGKFETDDRVADFAILEDDPPAVSPAKLKDIGVWGTMLGSKISEAPEV